MTNTSPAHADTHAGYAPAPPDLHDRVAAGLRRHGQQRISEAVGLSRATCCAVAARAPTMAMTMVVVGLRIGAIDDLDRRADDAAADARAHNDSVRDDAKDAKGTATP